MTKPGFEQRRLDIFINQAAEKYAIDWEETYPELDPEDVTPIEASKMDFIAGAKWMMQQLKEQQDGSK
jgi:hypothetical protein